MGLTSWVEIVLCYFVSELLYFIVTLSSKSYLAVKNAVHSAAIFCSGEFRQWEWKWFFLLQSRKEKNAFEWIYQIFIKFNTEINLQSLEPISCNFKSSTADRCLKYSACMSTRSCLYYVSFESTNNDIFTFFPHLLFRSMIAFPFIILPFLRKYTYRSR